MHPRVKHQADFVQLQADMSTLITSCIPWIFLVSGFMVSFDLNCADYRSGHRCLHTSHECTHHASSRSGIRKRVALTSHALRVQCINAQYDSEVSMNFYKFSMGGGTDNCHYGVFNSPDDDLGTATNNTVLLLSELARRCALLTHCVHVRACFASICATVRLRQTEAQDRFDAGCRVFSGIDRTQSLDGLR